MTKVEHRILVNVPVSVAYNQWTQFEDFPHFMHGVKKVTQLSDDRLEWVAELAGVRRKWDARILEQIPDTKVAWAATEGATNGETSPKDHEGMSMPAHEEMQGMMMEHGSMSHGMCGCGKCMMMMGMERMEMTGMEGMDHGSTSAVAKPAPQRNYGSGRSSGRGCGC